MVDSNDMNALNKSIEDIIKDKENSIETNVIISKEDYKNLNEDDKKKNVFQINKCNF